MAGGQGVKSHLKEVFEPSRGVMVVNASVTQHFGKVQNKGGLNSLPAAVGRAEDQDVHDDRAHQPLAPPRPQDLDALEGGAAGAQDLTGGEAAADTLADSGADRRETPQTAPRVSAAKRHDGRARQAASPDGGSSPLRKRLRQSPDRHQPAEQSETEARVGTRSSASRQTPRVLAKGKEEEEEEEEEETAAAGDKEGKDAGARGRTGGLGGATAGKGSSTAAVPKAAAGRKSASTAGHASILQFVKSDAPGASGGAGARRAAQSARSHRMQGQDDDMQVVEVEDEEEDTEVMADGKKGGLSRERRTHSAVPGRSETESDDDDDDEQAPHATTAPGTSHHLSDQDEQEQASLGTSAAARRARHADVACDADHAREGQTTLSHPRRAGKEESREQEHVAGIGTGEELSARTNLATDLLVDVDEPVACGGVSTSVDAGLLSAFALLLCA